MEKGYKKGYADAVNDACKWWEDYLTYPNEVELDKQIRNEMLVAFRKAMEVNQKCVK